MLYVEQATASEIKSRWTSQEIPLLLWNSEGYFWVCKTPPHTLIAIQTNLLPTITLYIWNVYLSILKSGQIADFPSV
jgi:hypothetical protein